jgi:hypothetical protein
MSKAPLNLDFSSSARQAAYTSKKRVIPKDPPSIPKDPVSHEEIKRWQEENKQRLIESTKTISEDEQKYAPLPKPPPSSLPPPPPPTKGGKRYRKTAKRKRTKRRHAKKTRGWFW